MDFAFLGAPLILNVNLRSLSSSVVVKYSRANFSVAPRNIGVQLKLESQCVTGTAPYLEDGEILAYLPPQSKNNATRNDACYSKPISIVMRRRTFGATRFAIFLNNIFHYFLPRISSEFLYFII